MSIWGALGNWGKSAGVRAGGWAGKAAGSFGSLPSTAKGSLIGAATGGVTGAFGLNPLNPVPMIGDVDAGGALGGALAGAGAGALYGKFGSGRNLFGRATGGLERGLRARGQMGSLIGGNWANFANKAHGALLKSNKYGDTIAAGMAAGTAGLIGGSVLSTNSPY